MSLLEELSQSELMDLCEKRKEVVYQLEREKHTLVDVLALTKKSLEDTEKEHTDMRLKIQKANHILDNWCKECEHDSFDSECENDCKIIDLKKALK
jgi:hypothetical protein